MNEFARTHNGPSEDVVAHALAHGARLARARALAQGELLGGVRFESVENFPGGFKVETDLGSFVVSVRPHDVAREELQKRVVEIVDEVRRLAGVQKSSLRLVGAAVFLAAGNGAVWVESLCPRVFLALRSNGDVVIAPEKVASSFFPRSADPDADAIKTWARESRPGIVLVPRTLTSEVSEALGFDPAVEFSRPRIDLDQLHVFFYPELRDGTR